MKAVLLLMSLPRVPGRSSARIKGEGGPSRGLGMCGFGRWLVKLARLDGRQIGWARRTGICGERRVSTRMLIMSPTG